MVSFTAALVVFALPVGMFMVGGLLLIMVVGISRFWDDHMLLWWDHTCTNIEISKDQLLDVVPCIFRPMGQIAYGLVALIVAVWPSMGQTAEILIRPSAPASVRALLTPPVRVVDMHPTRVQNRAPNGQYAHGWRVVWVSSSPV